MKKILFLFIAILISINASATKYYVATAANGGDNGNTGAIGSPWLTVDYAATQATTAGDTIYITAGTYNETARIELSVGVSIHGAGVTSIINSTYTSGTGLPNSTDGAIYLSSSSVTNGNQSISYIKLTGTNLTGWYAFFSENRNNVKVHHCTIEDFRDRGVTFHNPTWTTGIYATGNEIHDCIIKNSSDRGSGCGGNIQIHGQDGIKIYNNTLSVIDRAAGDNGQILSAISGWNKGVKYYNNVSTTLESNGTEWNFHLETWDSKGGWEIYDNEFHGGGCYIDLGGSSNVRGAYEYSFYIHDNLFARAATQAYNASRESVGIAIEGATSDVIVTRNYFKYCQFGVTISVAQVSKTTERIYINYNILENVGVTNNDWGGPFQIRLSAISDVVDDIYYENNVMTASASAASGVYAGLLCMQDGDAGQSFTDIYFRNNIVQGFLEGPIAIYLNGTVVTSLTNTHNVCYNNGNNNDIYYYGTATVTNYTVNNIIKSDPLFIGGSPYSYKLQETSPAKDAGLSVGLTSDYGGYSVPIGALPDIGAWEYGADVDPPNWTEQGIGWDRMQKKVNFRDTVNFTRGFMIAGVPISASGSGLEILGGLTASVDDLNATAGATGNFQGQINSIVASTVDDSKADTSLSNLASVAINTHLLPASSGSANLGSALLPFGSVYANGTVSLPSTTSIGDVSSTEIGYVNGVTSAIQTQINATESRVDSIVTVLADTVNIETLLQIDFDTDTVASLSDVRSLAGSGVVGVTLNSGTLTLTGDAGTADDITFYTNGDGSYNLPAGGGNLTIMSEVQGWINDSLDKAKVDIRKFDSDTIPLFVFGLGSGHSTDTALFNNGRLAGAFYNSGSDTLYVTELRGVLVEGTGTETIDVQVSWHANMRDVSAVNLNTSAITINNMTTGTSDVSFNNNGIPPGQWVWCVLSGASSGNKPTALMLTMTGYRRNRSY